MLYKISLIGFFVLNVLVVVFVAAVWANAPSTNAKPEAPPNTGRPVDRHTDGPSDAPLVDLSASANPASPDSFVDTGEWSQYGSADGGGDVMVADTSTIWVSSVGVVKWQISDPPTYTQYLRADPVREEAGPASNRGHGIIDDGAGGVWVNTYRGLSHFTGTEWITYTVSNSGLVHPVVADVARAGDGTLWITTDGGANHFDPVHNTWQTYTTANSGLPTNRLGGVAVDGAGTVWIMSRSPYLTSFDGATWHSYEAEDLGLYHNSTFKSLAMNPQGELSVGAYPGIARRNGQAWELVDWGRIAKDLEYDASGNLWITNGHYIERYDGTAWARYDLPNPNITEFGWIYTLDLAPDSLVWVGSAFALYSFDPATQTWRAFRASDFPTGMRPGYPSGLLTDAQGYPWFLSYDTTQYNDDQGGLARLDPQTNIWTKYTIQNSGLITSALRSMILDGQGNFWLATGAGLQKFDRATTWTTYTSSNSGLPGNRLGKVIADTDDNIWITSAEDGPRGAPQGITRFDGSTWATYNTQNSPLPSNDVSTLWADPNGSIWFGGFTFVGSFDGQNWRVWRSGQNGWMGSVNGGSKFAYDRNGILWVGGSQRYGLRRFDGNSWTYFNRSNSGILGNETANVQVDNTGIEKWVGAFGGFDQYNRPYTGVSVFNDVEWKHYTADTSPLDFILGVDIAFECRSVWIMSGEINRLKISPFSDVYMRDYYFTPIQELYCKKVISGYADGTFRPGSSTTRGQLCKIIVLAEGWEINTQGGPHFIDVPLDNPFYPFIETAYNHQIISGYSNGAFRPGNNVTRGQLCRIVVLAEGWPINTQGGPHFTDVPETSPFYAFIETAYNRGGIISGYGDGTFRPGGDATRGQISKIVYNAITAP